MTTTASEQSTTNPDQVLPDLESDQAKSDLDALLSDPSLVQLSDGQEYRVERLKTRGMLRLLKILTGGAQDVLSQTKFSVDMDPQEFAGIFIGAVLFSVPEQEDATVEFIRGMITPKHFIYDPRTPQEREANRDMMIALNNFLDDPDLDDTITILSAVMTIEAPHILSLGKKVMTLLEVQRKSRIAKASPKA